MHHIKPIVRSQTGKERQGRGFSPDELKESKLNAKEARELCIPIDRKRKTSHEKNVKTLKAHVEKLPKKTAKSAKEKKTKN